MIDGKKQKNMYLHNQIIQICQLLGHFASLKDKFVNKLMQSYIKAVLPYFERILIIFRTQFLAEKIDQDI